MLQELTITWTNDLITTTLRLPLWKLLGFTATVLLVGSWLGWWYYRFVLRQYIRPDEPRMYPYTVPYLGHAKPFFENSHKLVHEGPAFFKNSREPFSLTLAGVRYYVLTDSADASEFFNNFTTLSFDGLLNQSLLGFGLAKERLDEMWKPRVPSTANPKGKCIIHLTQDLYKQHLLPGPGFDNVMSKYEKAIDHLMAWEVICNQYGFVKDEESIEVDLFEYCGNFMIEATQMTLFDDVLSVINPTMTSKARFFTDELWKLMYPSRFLNTEEVEKIRNEFTESFMIYQNLPEERRKGESQAVTSLIQQYKAMGIQERDAAEMLLMVYWAGDANAYKLAFWMMCFILLDWPLFLQIQEETRPALKDGRLDLAYLAHQCPLLRATYHESLRLTKRDLAVRKVTADTFLGGKVLKAGHFAIVALDQLHDNSDAYGHDALSFRPERFLKDPSLANSAAYKPFGGGKTYCPGRYFAAQEIFGFIALQVHRLNIRTAPGSQAFPQIDDNMLTLGVSRPVPGTELVVTLSKLPMSNDQAKDTPTPVKPKLHSYGGTQIVEL